MRQAGIIAAGGLYALRNNVARLADDHRRARRLAEALAAVPGLDVDLGTVQTNMVFAGTRGTGVPAAELVERLAARGVLCLDEAPWSVRFVTHLDVDDEGVEQAIAVVREVLAAVLRLPREIPACSWLARPSEVVYGGSCHPGGSGRGRP